MGKYLISERLESVDNFFSPPTFMACGLMMVLHHPASNNAVHMAS